MSWETQGRQEHGWFGHGTGPEGGPDIGDLAERVAWTAHASLMGLPRQDWRNSAATFDGDRVQRLQRAMAAWIAARSLSRAEFERRFVGSMVSDAAIDSLRASAEAVRTATTHHDLGVASTHLASAMQGIGLSRWPGFLRDAADRADAAPPAGDGVRAQAINTATSSRPTSSPSAMMAAPPAAPVFGVQPQPIAADQLRTIMPNAGDAADDYVDALNQAMAANGIDTPEQRAAFLAQVAVESHQLQNTTENLNYTTAQRLQQVFGLAAFPSSDAAAPYLRNPEALANRVYANRNGNGDEASGDGYRYRGRGLMQTTGRENYRAVGHENDPETLEAPQGAANAAAQHWASHGLNGQTTRALNQQQFDEVSRTVNRYDPNLQARWNAYQRALGALGGGR